MKTFFLSRRCKSAVLVCGLAMAMLSGCSDNTSTDAGKTLPARGPAPAAARVGGFSFQYKGLAPKKFKEAPMLAELVKQGKLLPVEERLPKEPLIVPVVERIGKYGGTWRRQFTGPVDRQNRDRIMHDSLLYFDLDGTTLMPHIARSWEESPDGTTFTFHLRKGMKWSDGAPLKADDFIFAYEDITLNKDLNPVLGVKYKVEGKLARIEKVDDYTFCYVFDKPNYIFVEIVSIGGQSAAGHSEPIVAPKHFLKQFHPKYSNRAELDRKAREAGLQDWTKLFIQKASIHQSPETPVLGPWKTVTPITSQVYVLERNPYYWAVDAQGNQLPYIDRIEMHLAESLEIINLRAVAGEIDMQHRHIKFDTVPVLKDQKNATRGNYRVLLWPEQCGADAAIFVNQTWEGDPEIEKWLRNRDFRIALSLAIDREEINESLFLGYGEPRGFVPFPDNPYYPGEEYERRYKKRDVAKANRILDKLGLTRKDAEGYRLRTDGKGRLALNVHVCSAAFVDFEAVANLVVNHWADIGIKLHVKSEERTLFWQRCGTNKQHLTMWGTGGSENPWLYPNFTIPMGAAYAPLVGRWFLTKGKDGVEPTGKMKPMKRLIDIYEQGKAVPAEQRVELGKELWRILVEQQYVIGTVGKTPAFNGIVVVKNNFRNVPEVAPNSVIVQNPGIARPEQFFFEKHALRADR